MKTSFDRAAKTYDENAIVQALSSDYLAGLCSKLVRSVDPPPITVLDAGCGTGLTSLALRRFFPSIDITLCDISERMIAAAEAKIGNCKCIVHDMETYEFEDHYDLVISNLAMQWLEDFEAFLEKVMQRCEYLAFSVPTHESFLDYKRLFSESGIDILAIECMVQEAVIDAAMRHGTLVCSHHRSYSLHFSKALFAAKHFKNIGAGTPRQQRMQSKISAVLASAKEEICLNYEVLFVILKRAA
ncbi:MAG: methyltransferase domain-containing protein [Holosporales bacterium]|jgi:malonyl-ACP O-methyltransferase BioC|nr:methyltransferase domain-containing protein [Holosporales bacterium]